MVYAHVAQKTSWEQKSRVLHRALSTLPRECKLAWIGQNFPAEITVFLLFYYKGILISFITDNLILAMICFLRALFVWWKVVLLRIIAMELGWTTLVTQRSLEAQKIVQHAGGNMNQVFHAVEEKHWVLNASLLFDFFHFRENHFLDFHYYALRSRLTDIDLLRIKEHLNS